MTIKADPKYSVTEIPELNIKSYTQYAFTKNKKFTLDNFYFKKDKDKFELIEDILGNGDYIIFDTETTGVNNLGEDLPFQISAIKYRNNKEVDRLNMLINVGKLSDFILNLTGFTQELVDRDGIELKKAISVFIKFINDDKYIIAHNADFDIAILNNALVETNMFLDNNINILCSMQMYYTVYKHFLKRGVGGSSLDLLGHTLLDINVEDEKRHQADFDCEVVKVLLDKIEEDILLDYKKDNSEIVNSIALSESVAKNVWVVNRDYNDEKIFNWVKERANEASNYFEDYIDNYYLLARDIGDAIIHYLQIKTKDEYPEVEFGNYYIKRNKHFDSVKEEYLESYSYNKVRSFTKKGYEIDFFSDYFNENTNNDFVITTDSELKEFIKKFKELKIKMTELQMKVSALLKIVISHSNASNYSKYGDLTIKKEKIYGYNKRRLNKERIEKDFNLGLIKSKDDMISRKESYMNLTVEEIKI